MSTTWSATRDRLLVVLDDDHRVAEVAQARQRLDEAPVVPLVQPDRRLVEHVEHADERRADLAGEPDPLRLSPGEGRRGPVEGEVVEADVDEELDAGADLFQELLGDHRLPAPRARARRHLQRLADRLAGELGDVHAVDRDGERLRA